MRAELENTRSLRLAHNGGTIRPTLGRGTQGLPGPGAAAWEAETAVTTGAVRQAPDGSWIKSLGNRTTRAAFDATEETFWVAVAAEDGTVEQRALTASYGAVDDGVLRDTPRAFKPVNAALVTGMQTSHGFADTGTTAASVTDDTSDYLLGSQSLEIVTKTDNTAAIVDSGALAINAQGRSLRLLFKVDDSTNLTELLVYAGNSAFSAYYQWYLAETDPSTQKAQHFHKSGEWVWITLGFADASVIGAPDRSALTKIRLRARASNGNAVTFRVNAIAVVDEAPAFPAGVVSFTYDDSYASTFTEARKALDRYGYVGTAYTICDLVGSAAQWMTVAQMTELQRAGWEIAAHSYTLADHQTGFWNLTDQQLTDNLRNMRRWFTDNGFAAGDHLAYPQGGFDAEVLAIVDKFHSSARTVNRRTLETLRPADALRMRSFSVSNNDTVASVKTKIAKALENRGWLILTFHDLVAASADTSNEYLVADHQELVDYCATLGIPVMPVGDVMARLNGTVPAVGAVSTAALVNLALDNSSTKVNALSRKIANTATGVTAGDVNVTCFTPVVDLTIAALSARSGTVAWAGATLARIGLFTVNPDTGGITLVAATDNDITMFVAASTIYRRALGTSGGLPATYTLKAGQRYGIGVLGVGFSAASLLTGGMNSTLTARPPIICGKVAGQTDLPATATLAATGTPIWAEAG